jgi:formate dehydrogenase iron-sulfur subunit
MSTVTVYVPRDSAATSVGADQVAAAIAWRPQGARSASNSCATARAACCGSSRWSRSPRRQGRASPTARCAPPTCRRCSPRTSCTAAHPLRLGLVDELPWLKRQTRLTFARVGVIDPLEPRRLRGARRPRRPARARSRWRPAIVAEVTRPACAAAAARASPPASSGRRCSAPADQKYVVCNADEGDSGTFADRMLMEGDPFLLIEGMRSPASRRRDRGLRLPALRVSRRRARAAGHRIARAAGWLGLDVLGSGAFDVEVRVGAGAYICGEETSLLESLEGKRGRCGQAAAAGHRGAVRQADRHQQRADARRGAVDPRRGRAPLYALGVGRSRGTLPFQLAGNVKHGGLVEVPFGITLRELLYDFGGGTRRPADPRRAGRRPARRLPARVAVRPPLDYEAFAAGRRDGRPRRHRGVRRHGRHGAHGPLRDGVLRHRVVRQVHAVPHRLARAASR